MISLRVPLIFLVLLLIMITAIIYLKIFVLNGLPPSRILEKRFATTDSISLDDWMHALPSDLEIREMKALIQLLFTYDSFKNFDGQGVLALFPELNKSMNITVLSGKYCVVHEKFMDISEDSDGMFPRFFGYVAVTSVDWAERSNLHHSAAHFQSDGDVCAQAAAIFQKTRSRSLTVAGASRFAIKGSPASLCQPYNTLADASHNINTMFHTMNMGILETVHADDVFIQWHGMANATCEKMAVFGSAGVKESNGVYNNSSAVINMIVKEINSEIGKRVAETPATAKCALKATTNVFGRAVNGVPATDVCTQNTKNTDVPGKFVHLEQKGWIADDWDFWAKILQRTFPL